MKNPLPKIDKKMVFNVALGIAAFGAAMYVVRMLPNNGVTNSIKKAAASIG